MSLKFFVLALLVATPVLASLEDQHLGFRNENAVIEAINKLIETAKHIVADYIEQLKEKFTHILHDIKEVISENESEIIKNIGAVLKDVKEKLDQAKELGKDAAECVMQQKEKIEKLNEATAAKLRKCVSGVVAELTKLFDNLVQSLNDVNEEILALLDQFYACADWSCKAGVGKQIAEEVLEVNKVMGDSITHFLAIVRENRESVRACVKSSMDSFKSELAKIAEELEACMQQ